MAQSSCTTSSPFTIPPPSCSTETFMPPLLHPEPQADRLSLHFCTAEGVGLCRANTCPPGLQLEVTHSTSLMTRKHKLTLCLSLCLLPQPNTYLAPHLEQRGGGDGGESGGMGGTQPSALPSRANSSLTSAAHYRGNSVSVVFLITQEAMLLLLFIIYMIRQACGPYSLLPTGLHSLPPPCHLQP